MEAHSPRSSDSSPRRRPFSTSTWMPGPVLVLAMALGLFLGGGAMATALGLVTRVPFDPCESVAVSISHGLDLAGADLSRAMLGGAGLCGADLRGAILEGACLRGARLEGADFTGAVLRGSDMTGARTAGAVGLPADLPNDESACD